MKCKANIWRYISQDTTFKAPTEKSKKYFIVMISLKPRDNFFTKCNIFGQKVIVVKTPQTAPHKNYMGH